MSVRHDLTASSAEGSPDVRAAMALVRHGVVISLARQLDLAEATGPHAPGLRRLSLQGGVGAAVETLVLDYHGDRITHIDAPGHMWGPEGIWGGHQPDDVVQPGGLSAGGVEIWRDGLVRRAVLLDIVGYRGEPYVTSVAPVTGAELEAAERHQQTPVRPGDAIAVHCGHEAWEAAGRPTTDGGRPGLDSSCLSYLRDRRAIALLWDMNEALPPGGARSAVPVHSAIWTMGLAVIDGVHLERLTRECHQRSRMEFMLVVAPLTIVGASGSPVNPLAFL